MDDVLDVLSIGVVVHDASGAIVRWNRAAEAILGLTADELAGRTPADPRWRAVRADQSAWPGEEHPASITLRTGRRVDDELMGVHRPDGRTVWLRVSSAPILGSEGVVESVVATFADVTERRAEFRTIEQSERRFRNAFSGSPMAEAIIDGRGRMIDHNSAMAQLLGVERDGLAGLDTWSLVPDSERAGADALVQRLRTAGEARLAERAYVRPDGTTRWVTGRLRTIEWPGADGCVLVQLIDVTEERHVRAELERSEERFRVAFSSAPVPMSILDVDGMLLAVNSAWERQLGVTADDAVGTSFERFCAPRDAERVVAVVTAMFKRGDRSTVVGLELRRPDGGIRHVEAYISVIEIGGELSVLTQSLDTTTEIEQARLIEYLSEHDVLTGLLNRRGFTAAAEAYLGRVAAPSGAILVADLDGFKYVNETRGPLVGDEAITMVAAALRRTLPAPVAVARLGGDEFGVLVPGGGDGVADVAALVVDTVRQVDLGELRVDAITVSVGVALIDDRMLTIDELLAEADLAMYEAKELGRDRFVVASGTLATPGAAPERSADAQPAALGWAARIERALDEDAFVVVAEPIVSLADGEVVQHELLIRMAGDAEDVIGTADVIRIAERVGMVQRIDTWMAQRAIATLAVDPRLVLTVNLSTVTMNDSGFLDAVERRLGELSVDPARLIFEVTETAAVSNLADARRFAWRLVDIGCRVALDDFGTGFGSFAYLKHLPFDFLKIDGEFVRSAVTNRADTAIIRSLVGLARELGKRTIAEYTHDAATYEHVRALGVDLAQGRHVGRGVRLDAPSATAP